MIIDILELAAVLEWLALGTLTFFKLRSLNRRARDFMDNLEAIETIEALGLGEIVREDGEPKRKPTMNEIRALYGLEEINNNEYVHLRKENAEDAVR